jgi:hypothetical protein
MESEYESGSFGRAIFKTKCKGITRGFDLYCTIKSIEKKFVLIEDNDNFLYLVDKKDFQFTKEDKK